tara:strand:+ start:49 stop:375 length:327 start_codon:yes stop_codon:yes gene_type:complete
MDYKKLMGYGDKKKVTKKQSNSTENQLLEGIKQEFGYVNETLPAYAREWKGLEKACYDLEKAVKILGKAVEKQDKKKGKLIPNIYKTLDATIQKFKKLISDEILSKLQ